MNRRCCKIREAVEGLRYMGMRRYAPDESDFRPFRSGGNVADFHALTAVVKSVLPALLLLSVSCARHGFMPQDGDLLFCVAEPSAMSDAIVDATGRDDAGQFDHVALFAATDGKPCVIEASPECGVVCRDWESFLSDAGNGLVVKRIRMDIDVEDIIRRARRYVGLPYDWSFLPDNGKVYCSELIYESYLDRNGSHIFRAAPMRFRDADGNMPRFWTDLFGGSEESVPEGILGTNPNDLSKDEILEEVHRYDRP